MLRGDAVLCRECVQPEDGVLDEVDDDDLWSIREQHGVPCASSSVLDGSDVPLDGWDVIVSPCCLKEREGWAHQFKFGVGKERSDAESAVLVEADRLLEAHDDGPCLPVWKGRHHTESQCM